MLPAITFLELLEVQEDRAEIAAATPDLDKGPTRFTVLPLDTGEPAIAI